MHSNLDELIFVLIQKQKDKQNSTIKKKKLNSLFEFQLTSFKGGADPPKPIDFAGQFCRKFKTASILQFFRNPDVF